MVIHYEDALYQLVYAPLPLPYAPLSSSLIVSKCCQNSARTEERVHTHNEMVATNTNHDNKTQYSQVTADVNVSTRYEYSMR